MPQQNEKKIFTPFPKDLPPPGPPAFKMPFYYDAASFMWVFYRAPLTTLKRYLKGTGLEPARFTDCEKDGIVSLNFQLYLSNLGMALTSVQEVEFNIHSYPKSKEKETPLLSFEDYMIGQEQTKWIGGFHLHVPADDPIAVEAGQLVFGERKFATKFEFNIPVPNNPTQKKWHYSVFDPAYDPKKGKPKPSDKIYTIDADIASLPQPIMGNLSPLTLYSQLPGGPDLPPSEGGRLNASRWNIQGLYPTWFNPKRTAVKLSIGKSEHPMRQDLETLIGKSAPVAIRIRQSPPAAIENRAFWVEPT